MQKMIRLILVRHGLANGNEEHRYLGHIDESLAEPGRMQAATLQQKLAELKIDFLYSSKLQRAISTAEIIGQAHSLLPVTMPEFNEIGFGEWEGLTTIEIEKAWPGLIKAWFYNPQDYLIPGGEPWSRFRNRILSGLSKMIKDRSGTILLVTHGGVLRTLLGHFLGLETPATRMRFDHGGITIIDLFEGSPVIQSVNDICHLPPAYRGDR